MKIIRDKQVWGWVFYDWANSVFATVVIAGFFPVVFKQYWASDLSSEQSTFWLGSANSVASLIVVLLAPLLGSLADCAGIRKRLLLLFMLFGVVATMMFYTIDAGLWWLVLVAYIFGILGFMAAKIFYDAMLVEVSRHHHMDKISGVGFGFGYLGGGILLALCVFMTEQPAAFGFHEAIDVVLFSFILTAIWWFVFSLPLAFWVDESRPVSVQRVSVRRVFSETVRTFRHVLGDKQIRLFLLAYWIYIDGVDTIIRMAVDYGLALGFDSGDLIIALLITQFVGFPAAIVYTHIGDRIGTRKALFIGLAIYALITLWGYQMVSVTEFYALAVMIGLVQGGVQALSRSYYARMIPADRAAEYFGIYNMMGKSAAILGPVLMGLIAVLTDNHRYSILSIMIFFIVGMLLLLKVKDPVRAE